MDRTDEDRPEVVVVVHLVNGAVVTSKPGPLTRPDIEMFKKFLGERFSKGTAGWQVNIELENGWAIFPKASVLYLSIHPAVASDDAALALLHDEKPS